jgi:ADP-dependent NAD(P)H-hydrate dehydratase / NAD(P)H-hydrate epimerase
MYLVTASEMQDMDHSTIESYGIPGLVLMENAGRGATRMLLETFFDIRTKKVGIIAGKGNNGGDGFVIARYLHQYGVEVTVYLLSKAQNIKGDAKTNLKLLNPMNIPVIEMPDKPHFEKNRESLDKQEIWVDAILGTGLTSDVKGFFKDIINFVNNSRLPVFSVDIPSGLNSDTGHPHGTCINADATATFAFAKSGHIHYPGSHYTGRLGIVDIGIPEHIVKKTAPFQNLITFKMVCNGFCPRQEDAHKGTAGHLLVLAGSPGKTGAAAMASISAMKSGAGLVTLGVPASLNPVLESQVLEVMTEPLAETRDSVLAEASFDSIIRLMERKTCLVIGPGLGMSDETGNLIKQLLLHAKIPVVLDADGINHLSGSSNLLKKINIPVILTPHPGEMERLTGDTILEIQKDRTESARKFATEFGVHLVLKGVKTVIAHPDGSVYINPTGNPAMASGGMGDVLTGIIGGLVTQGYSPEYACNAGVFIHGASADSVMNKTGPVGILASEVLHAIPEQFSNIEKRDASPYTGSIPCNLGL